MKLKLGLAALLGATVLFARDIIVPASELPRNAQDFISKNFKTAQIALVKKDIDSYDVTLNDGTEIDFIITGEWKEVDGNTKLCQIAFCQILCQKSVLHQTLKS